MPELAEVEITKRKISKIKGKKIKEFKVLYSPILQSSLPLRKIYQDIKGRKVENLKRKGKVIFIYLNNKAKSARVMAFHMRMSGRIILISKRTAGLQLRHIRLKIKFTDHDELIFDDQRKFGRVWYDRPEAVFRDRYFTSLAEDALKISFYNFSKQLKKHKGMIKPVLLNQKVIAGIGNIIADEALWLAKIHPQRRIVNLSQREIQKLYKAIKKVIRTAIIKGGTTFRNWSHPDGKAGEFLNYLKIYGKKNNNCLRCEDKILKIKVGSRGTWICSSCQKM